MDKNYTKLSESNQYIYTKEIAKCKSCKSFDECKQQNKGLYPIIIEPKFSSSKFMRLAYTKCNKYPGEIKGSYNYSIKNVPPLYENAQRNKILNKLRIGNGGFLYGNAGVGKSTIMKNLAKEFNSKGKDIYYELANNITVMMKEFKDTEKKMKLLQKTDILFIDDFAREVMTAWVILNIWSPILQYRIDNGLPIYLSCNYSLSELFVIIENNADRVAAETIIGRIKTIGSYHLEDKDYRLGGNDE